MSDQFEACPTCGRLRLVYKRSIRPHLIVSLRAMFDCDLPTKLKEVPGVDLSTYPDFKRLELWGFIELSDPEVYGPGFYEPTIKAASFLRGFLRVPRVIHVYQGESVEDRTRLERQVYVDEVMPETVTKKTVLDDSYGYSDGTHREDLFA